MVLDIAQSTPTGDAIGQWVGRHYAFGDVVHCELLRRSFNQVYGLRFANGRRAVARLAAERPRGAPNIDYETALLGHLRAQGFPVADVLRARDGAAACLAPLPEGARPLMLFEHLEGDMTGDAPVDIAAFGRGLARLHAAAGGFAGCASRYTLDLDYLLMAPMRRLLLAPTMTQALSPQFEAIAHRLRDRILAMGPLSQVVCHGDAHGDNNFVVDDPAGEAGARQAWFFDFDEAGPGYLAYELAVYPWSLHPRGPGRDFDPKLLARWHGFIRAYEEERPLDARDRLAIPAFMAVRQFWLLGEYAGRIPVWGSQAMPTAYLRRQAEMLTQWETLVLPEPAA